MNNVIRLVAICLVLIAPSLNAQTPSQQKSPLLKEAKPASVGMSSSRLERMESMLQQAIADQQIPGVVALIARNGKIVFWRAYGYADAAKQRPLQRDSIFRIASQTKAITSTAVMMLWEEGRFQLDDPISKYLPEFKNPQILNTYNEDDGSYTTKPASREITLRDLLTHTSGIGYSIIGENQNMMKIYQNAKVIDAFTDKPVTQADNIKVLAALPLHHNPGERFTYGMGIDVMGHFVEVISGMTLQDFMKERIFKPLDMKDTDFYQPKEKADRLVEIQTYKDDHWETLTSDRYDVDYPLNGSTFFSGGGGLSSTANDYAKFLQMYLYGGEYNGKRLLSRTTIDTIMANQIGDIWGPKSEGHHGLAFKVANQNSVAKGGIGSAGTFEWGGYFNTQYYADPQENIIGILLKQTLPADNDETSWKYRILAGQAIDD